MKKLYAFTLVMAMPASAASVVSSPVAVQLTPSSQQSVSVPLAVGGYASIKSNGKCCTIVRITDMVLSSDAAHQPIWIATYYSDSSGNWPVGSDYWRTAQLRFDSSGLQGVAIN